MSDINELGRFLRTGLSQVEPQERLAGFATSIPSALAYAAAEDLIALAEDAYAREADELDADIGEAYCSNPDGLCGWDCCDTSGCVIDKFHRGLALRAAASAQGTLTRSAETEGLSPKDSGPVLEEDAPLSQPEGNHP